MKLVNDEKTIRAIAAMLLDMQERENTNLPLLTEQLKETQRGIDNLLNAIQQGIFTKSTKGRLEELEAAKEELEIKIANEKIAKPKLTEEQILSYLHKFRVLDMSKQSHRQRLIDTFINRIYLYDDKLCKAGARKEFAMKHSLLTRDEKRAITFLLPGVLVTALLIIYPLVYIVSMSFSEDAMNMSGFAGLTNYTKLFKNPQLPKAIVNTLNWTLATVIFSFLIGFGLALLINRRSIRLKGFWRGAIFIAWIIPGVVKATAWKWLFTTDGGMINHILLSLGLIQKEVPWLTSRDYAMLSVIIVQVWACAPYVMLMMTAGLQQLPMDQYESAELDGANWHQKMLHITLPLLKDVSFICILMTLVWAINEFSLIWIMTSGGHNTTTLSLLVYNQFKVLNINSASASAVMQLIITMVFAGLYVKFVIKED